MILSVLFALCGVPQLFSVATANECANLDSVVEIGVQRTDGRKIPASINGSYRTWRPREIEDRSAKYVRFRIERGNQAATGWRLAIRSQKLRLVESLGPDDFSESVAWTRRIYMDKPGENDPSLALELNLGDAAQDPELIVKGYQAMPADADNPFYSSPPESTEVDLFDTGVDEEHRLRGDSVGMMLANFGSKSWCCTGVFLAKDLMLTNWHCGGAPRESATDQDWLEPRKYWTSRVCESVFVDNSWDADEISRELVPVRKKPCVVAQDRELDYALLRLRGRPPNGPTRAAPVMLGEIVSGDDLSIIHHAGCQPKRLSLECKVDDVDHPSWITKKAGTDFTHSCSTELGSSGAPVFDSEGRVVGLHHLGFMWKDECNTSDGKNKAVKIGKILEHLPRALCLEIVDGEEETRCAE